jgi:glycine oxidase
MDGSVTAMTTEVIVVGGGAIGLAIADRLAERGDRVVLVDAQLPGQASWAGSGALALIMPQLASPPLRELARHSSKRWPDFAADLQERSGVGIERRNTGLLRLVYSPSTQDSVRSTGEWLTAAGVPSELLDASQIAALAPLAADPARTALYQAELWQLRPPRLLRALQAALSAHSSATVRRARVGALLQTASRVRGVRLICGEKLYADEVVIAAGAWSGELLAAVLGRPLPVRPVKGEVVCLDAADVPGGTGGPLLLGETNIYLVPRSDGRVLAGSTFDDVGFSARTTAAGLQHILRGALVMAPGLADASMTAAWAGLRPGTPDGLPYVGRIPGLDGLIIATGHFRDGLLLTPGTADIVASILHGETVGIDLCAYRPDRPVPRDSTVDAIWHSRSG